MDNQQEYNQLARELLGKALNMLIEDKKLNKDKLAEELRMSNRTLFTILKGKANYSIDNFFTIARRVGVHIEITELNAENNIWNMDKD